MTDTARIKVIRRASWIGILVNIFLALTKIIAGFLTNSMSVLADGIDSSGDVLSAIIMLYISTLIARPPSIKFPYGYAKAETNATNILALIIFVAGFQLAIAAIKKLISGEITQLPDMAAIYVVALSIVSKFGLARYQYLMGKKTNSPMLLATAKNMQGDVLISLSVLTGLVFTYVFKLPVLDPIAALLVSLWVVWVAVRIFYKTNIELMDGSVDQELYEKVFKLLESFDDIKNPHRLRIRKIGSKDNINVDVEMDGGLSLAEAHKRAHAIEEIIQEQLPDVFDVSIHVEPVGDHIEEKAIGVSPKRL